MSTQVQMALGEKMGQHLTHVPLPVCHLPLPPSSQTPLPSRCPLYSSEAELEGQVKTLCLHLLNPHASASAGTPWPAQGEQCSGR